MADIFISYSKHDRDLAEGLAAELQSTPYEVWWDTNLVTGDDFTSEIRKNIEAAKLVIVIWTHDSINSIWVKAEANLALAGGKLAAVRVPELDPKEIPLPFGLQHTPLIDDKFAILQAAVRHCGAPQEMATKRFGNEAVSQGINETVHGSDTFLPAPVIAALPGMTNWFIPRLLLQQFLGDFLSARVNSLVGDTRTLDQSEDAVYASLLASRYDYSATKGRQARLITSLDDDGAFWVDFLGCTGDGFDSTYAAAFLLTDPELRLAGVEHALPRSQFLVLGGDHCYPVPNVVEYQRRLLHPFQLSAWHVPARSKADRRVFAIPGKMDLLDSARTFKGVFCRRRDGVSDGLMLGDYRCDQHRTYWALQLPNDWLLFGVDISAGREFDPGQIRYFSAIVDSIPSRAAQQKIILILPEPGWLSGAGSEKLAPLIRIIGDRAVVALVLSAGMRNYSRYAESQRGLCLIVAGNGGAHLEATHTLPDRVEAERPEVGQPMGRLNLCRKSRHGAATKERSCWPSKGASRMLSFAALAFPFRSYWFSAGFGLYYSIMSWLFALTEVKMTVSPTGHPKTVMTLLGLTGEPSAIDGPLDLVGLILFAGQANPLLGLLGMGLFGMAWYYADAPSGGGIQRTIMALVHWWAHILMAILLWIAVTKFNVWLIDYVLPAMGLPLSSGWARAFRDAILPPFEYVLVGGLAAGFVWGLYLTVCCLFGRHCHGAFTSMRLAGYLQFLRMKIEPSRITIYPIGLRTVPNRSGWRPTTREERDAGVIHGYVPKKPLRPELIEDPIVIHTDEIKSMWTENRSSEASPKR